MYRGSNPLRSTYDCVTLVLCGMIGVMKKCPACKVEKDLDQFGNNKHKRDGKQTHCKECRVDYNKRHYQKTKDRWKKSRAESRKASFEKGRVYIEDYLSVHHCVDCGESDIRTLEFDHVRGTKEFNIGSMSGYSLEKIIKEIEKCEVRCANCHRKATYDRMGNSWRHKSHLRSSEAELSALNGNVGISKFPGGTTRINHGGFVHRC